MRWFKDTRTGDVTGVSGSILIEGNHIVEVLSNPEGFNARLKELCADRCADCGDPPCYMLPELVSPCEHITPCAECLADLGGDHG
jgi:hypothetical protein